MGKTYRCDSRILGIDGDLFFSYSYLRVKSSGKGMEKAIGMGNSQMDEYEKTAQPGEFSAWSDAMFGGMPYVSGYGNPAHDFPDIF